MSKKILFLASLASLPLVSLAQTDPGSSHFYVGVGASLLTEVPFTSAGTPRLLGPSLTAGVYLAPHLALQASASYYWRNETYTSPSYSYGTGSLGGDSYTDEAKYLMVPVLLHYTFTPSTSRLQFDGLAGVTVVHTSYHYTSTTTFSGIPRTYENKGGLTRASVTLGPAIRYSVSPQVELTANGLVSAVVGDTYYNFSDRLFLNVLAGAQYSFGSR
jgi:hypothetical protein